MLNLKTVRDAAYAALEAEGDHVYKNPVKGQNACTYTTPDGEPSCVVGHVINRIEPLLMPLINEKEWATYREQGETPQTEYVDVAAFNASELNIFRFSIGETYTDLAIMWLNRAQQQQDADDRWSVALREADEWIRIMTDPTVIDHVDAHDGDDLGLADITASLADAVAAL